MRSTRERILRRLLAFPESTINDLADSVGINPISVRHHLTSLQSEGLVTSTEERHGVGRPRLVYSLTENGTEAFPTNYIKLMQRLLNKIKDKYSDTELDQFFQDIGEEIAMDQIDSAQDRTLDQKVHNLQALLTREGFIVELVEDKGSFLLTTLSCPYYRIGMEHPQICSLDHALISKYLGKPVKFHECIHNGAEHCTYQIQKYSEEGAHE